MRTSDAESYTVMRILDVYNARFNTHSVKFNSILSYRL
jgi:hypothetical protein